jgi:hypothetical protein
MQWFAIPGRYFSLLWLIPHVYCFSFVSSSFYPVYLLLICYGDVVYCRVIQETERHWHHQEQMRCKWGVVWWLLLNGCIHVGEVATKHVTDSGWCCSSEPMNLTDRSSWWNSGLVHPRRNKKTCFLLVTYCSYCGQMLSILQVSLNGWYH